MTKPALRRLRETFRARMEQEDFCIGQEKVEKLFRELLGEPEPVDPPREYSPASRFDLEKFNAAMKEAVANTQDFFTRENVFYSKIRQK